jgi:hypothetical protein
MRAGWIFASALLGLSVVSSAIAQGPHSEADNSTDTPRLHRSAQPIDEADDRTHGFRRGARIGEMRQRYREATPEQRRQMRAKRLRRMESFGPRGRRSGALAGMSREDRVALRAEVGALPDEERHELRRKLRHFHSLPENEQAELKQRFSALRTLDSVEQDQIQHNTERWNQMDPKRREELRDTWQRFRALPPDVQQEVLDKALLEESTSAP